MKSFLNSIKDSIYNPEFYRTVTIRPLSDVFKYYFKLVVLVALLITVVGSLFLLPAIINFVQSAGMVISRDYPKDLVITLKDGIASTNLTTEPHFPKVPPEFVGMKINDKPVDHLIVIDTRSPVDTSTFLGYNSYAMLGKDSVAVRKDDGQVSIQSLNNMSDMVLDHNMVADFISRLPTLVRIFAPGLVILSFIVSSISYLFVLVYLLIIALFVWGVARLKGFTYNYKDSYKTAIYATTLPIILNFVLLAFGITIPWLFTLVVLLVVSVNLRKSGTVAASVV
jgi:hypothetical protein